MQKVFLPVSGKFAASVLLALLIAATSGCYSFSGGGGFPADIRTVYIQPFENQTSQFELDQQIFAKLVERLPRSLGVRPAGQDVADAIVRGRVVRYDDIVQNYTPGSSQQDIQVLQHQVTVTIAVEIIDVKRRLILWDSNGLSGKGEYVPGRQSDVVGRELAIENLVQQIVDGAQSQW